MKIVIAPDSFKSCLPATEVANSIEHGLKKVFPNAQIRKVPMADGGEGTVEALIFVTNGKIHYSEVLNPLGDPITAKFGVLGDGKTAVIEMATASGLPLIPIEKRNPLLTTTFGTGQLIRTALDLGCRKMIIGIGGSATNDGGAGMAQALGAKLIDENGKQIGFGGGQLDQLRRIDISELDPRICETQIFVACDVENPLIGENGASKIYGPQKGATSEMINILDRNLSHFAKIVERDLKKSIADVPGAGAAGGLGGGLIAFLDGELRSGIDLVISATKFDEILTDVNLVITGEGKIDHQTAYGKTPIGVAKVAKNFGIPVIAIAGSVGENAEILRQHGIDEMIGIVDQPTTLDLSISNASEWISRTATRVANFISIGMEINTENE